MLRRVPQVQLITQQGIGIIRIHPEQSLRPDLPECATAYQMLDDGFEILIGGDDKPNEQGSRLVYRLDI